MDAIHSSFYSAQSMIDLMGGEVPDLHRRVGTTASSRFTWSDPNIYQSLHEIDRGIIGNRINEGLRASLICNSRLDSAEISDLVDSFSLLHKLIKKNRPYNKKQIIEHVYSALRALEAVIGKNTPTSDIEKEAILEKLADVFDLPSRQDQNMVDINMVFEEMGMLRLFLHRYLSYLEGKEPCTKEQLETMRRLIAQRLFQVSDEGARGFLHLIVQVQYRQMGNLPLTPIMQNVLEATRRAAMKVFAPFLGMSPNAASSVFSQFDDPDIPGWEIIQHPDGRIETVSHILEQTKPHSVFNLLNGVYEYFKNGTSSTFLTWYIETLKVALSHIKDHVHHLREGTQVAIGQLDPLQEEFLASNQRTSASLERSLQILNSLQRPGITKESIETSIHEIAEILKNHPIGIKYLFHINLFSYLPSLSAATVPPTDAKDPVDVLQDMIRNLEGEAQTHQAIQAVDETTAFSWELENVRKTSIRLTIYEAVFWWISWCPWWLSWISSPLPSNLSIPTFDLLMAKLYKPDGTPLVTPLQEEQIFRESLLEMIGKSTHLFFITRWITEFALSLIEWVCTYAISRVFQEADIRLMQFINKSYDEVTGDAKTSIPDTLTAVSNAIVNAYKLYSERQNSSRFDKHEIIAYHLFQDPRKLFLKGHNGKKSIYQSLETVLISLLREFSWTDWISGLSSDLLHWASDTNYTFIQAVCWMIVAPIRALLWTVNTAIVWPLQIIANILMKQGASFLISLVELPKLLTEKGINSIIGETDFTPVLDDIILDLLKMLWELMQEPEDPNSQFGDIKTSPKTVDALANMLSSLLKVLRVSKSARDNQLSEFFSGNRGGDITATLQGLSNSFESSALNGASHLLAKSMVILARKQKKIATLALSTLHKAMITKNSTPRFIAGENISVLRRSRALIDHYISLLGWEGVKMATNKLSAVLSDPSSNEEHRINKHAHAIQRQFGFHSIQPNPSDKVPIRREHLLPSPSQFSNIGFQYQSRLIEWMGVLYTLSQGNPQNPIVINAIGNLDKIHKEMLEISHSLRSELILMESDNSISKAALEVHKEKILAISEALSSFQKGFQTIHEFYLNKAHPALSNIYHLLAHVHFRTSIIQRSLINTQLEQNALRNGEVEIQNLRFQLQALKELYTHLIENIPPQGPISQIAQLLDMSIKTLETNLYVIFEKQKNYINFTKNRIHPIQTASGALSDFTSRVLEFATHNDKSGLSTFLQTHLAEIQTFLPLYNVPGTHDQANFATLQRILSLANDLLLLTDTSTKKHTVIQRCNEFKDTLLRIGSLLQNEVNSECTRMERTLFNLTTRTFTQLEATGQTLYTIQTSSPTTAVQEAIGSPPTNPERTDGKGMFLSILQIEKAVASLTSVDKASFDLFQTIPIASFVQKQIFDVVQRTVYDLLKTVIQDKSVIEGFVMRLYVRFLESQGIDLSAEAKTSDHLQRG